ncbi:MAG: hypothetical protein HRT99_00760 [Mycoplasmatales bacterium]|nr:hypothetical protein [Mycoplasmatales bacterium]
MMKRNIWWWLSSWQYNYKIISTINASDKNNIVIDGLLDNFDSKSTLDVLQKLRNLKKKILIFTNNKELLYKVVEMQKDEYEKNESSGSNEDHIDFKIIMNNHNLSWQLMYIHQYWWFINNNDGVFKDLDNKKHQMNEADIAALILASRYWGKANSIFKMPINFNKTFFKELTLTFFHKKESDISFEDFSENILINKKFSLEKISNYLSIDDDLQFNEDNFKKMIDDMSAMKRINLDQFVRSLYGRELLETKK